MTAKQSIFVTFKNSKGEANIAVDIDDMLFRNININNLLSEASNTYSQSIFSMQIHLREIKQIRNSRRLLPAKKIWLLGDMIFDLVEKLKALSLEIDDLYKYLERDLEVKRKWLEKVIVFRRYIDDPNKIPENLNWGKCEKGTRRIAENINAGVNLV